MTAARARNGHTPVRREPPGFMVSVGGGFGGGVHTVLRNFMDAAGWRLDALAIEMIEWDAAFANRVPLFDGFGNVGLSQRGRLEQGAPSGKLRRKCRSKGAA